MISQWVKLSVGYQVKSGDYKNYKRTRQGALAVLLLYLYKLHVVRATTISTGPYVHASSSCPITYPHVFSLRPPYCIHVPWHHTFNLHCTCTYHVYIIRNPCPLTSSLTLSPSRLFLILLDPKFFQTVLDSVTWLPGHIPIFTCCRLIIITTIYTCPNPNPSPSLSTLLSYNSYFILHNNGIYLPRAVLIDWGDC